MLREIDEDIWTHEESLRYLGFEMGRRMTVVRIAGGLWVHSPGKLTPGLRDSLGLLGEVRWLTPASILHGHTCLGEYAAAFPSARVFGVAGLERKHPTLSFAGDLTGSERWEWSQAIERLTFEGHRVAGRVLNEVEFLHLPTKTLICGDLCFNIGDGWPIATRLLARGPRMRRRLGPTVAFRLGIRDREAARRSVERILAWDFERILPGHGEVVETGGRGALRDEMAWLLGG